MCVILLLATACSSYKSNNNNNSETLVKSENNDKENITGTVIKEDSENKQDNSKESVSNTYTGEQSDYITIKSEKSGLIMRLPKDWEGRYICDVDKSDKLMFDLYCKYNYDLFMNKIGVGGGKIVIITAYPISEIDSYPEQKWIIGKNKDYFFVYYEPSDVQAMEGNQTALQEYKEMFADVQGIIERFISDNNVIPTQNFYSDGYKSKVNMKSYSISIPRRWKAQEKPSDTVEFEVNNTTMGGVNIQAFYPDYTLTNLIPNHSEALET